MHCPTLAELPMPPKGKKGWPWTEKSHQLPNNLLNGRSWPKISIVTPSYNQGQFIEETIRSVLLQSYPNIEYFVIDGGSNDESLEIIQKYEPWITYWVSESDNGQTNAINKGFKKARGEIVTWLNSDDLYTVNTLFTVAKTFIKQSNSAVVYGNADIIDTNTSIISHLKSREFNLKNLYRYDYIRQPASFIKTEAIEKIGYLNEKFHYTMDYDLWIRLGQEQAVMRYIPTTLAWFRLHKNSKSISQFEAFWLEEFIMLDMALKRKTPDASIAGIAYSICSSF